MAHPSFLELDSNTGLILIPGSAKCRLIFLLPIQRGAGEWRMEFTMNFVLKCVESEKYGMVCLFVG